MKIPRPAVPKGEKQTAVVGIQPVVVTKSGLEARKKELEDLKAQRPEIIAAIRTAAADKNYRENAPLDAAREEQGKVEARIRELEEEIRRCTVVTKARWSKGEMTEPGLEARMKELLALRSLRSEIDRDVQTEAHRTGRAPIGVAARKTDISARIRELEEEIRDARVVETTASSPADLGAGVKLRSMEDGTTRTYTIVGPFEANPSEGKLSIKSPVGEAVAGKRKRNQITVKTPSGGERRYRIDKVAF